MDRHDKNTIRINVDPANPGQFFACCGLLELADRLWHGAEGWFENDTFCISKAGGFEESDDILKLLLDKIKNCGIEKTTAGTKGGTKKKTAPTLLKDRGRRRRRRRRRPKETPPMLLKEPFALYLDWWNDKYTSGKELKIWAGSMNCLRIGQAMKKAIPLDKGSDLLNFSMVVEEGGGGGEEEDEEEEEEKKAKRKKGRKKEEKKVEPYCFDSRRAANVIDLDVGFSLNKLNMRSFAYPAVEFLCLIGLQRHRPRQPEKARPFEYYTWQQPLEVRITPFAVLGMLPAVHSAGFRFENVFRTSQRKHKAFAPATPIT